MKWVSFTRWIGSMFSKMQALPLGWAMGVFSGFPSAWCRSISNFLLPMESWSDTAQDTENSANWKLFTALISLLYLGCLSYGVPIAKIHSDRLRLSLISFLFLLLSPSQIHGPEPASYLWVIPGQRSQRWGASTWIRVFWIFITCAGRCCNEWLSNPVTGKQNENWYTLLETNWQ